MHEPIPLQIPLLIDVHVVPYGALPVSAHNGPVPAEQYCTPTVHSRGTHAAAGMSSVTPLQLSSRPLHTSAEGAPGTALHVIAPAVHAVTPVRRHTPTPAVHGSPIRLQTPPQLVCPAGHAQLPTPSHVPPEGLVHDEPAGSLLAYEQA